MFSRDREQTGLIIDYCLGLCSPAEAQKAEESIANKDGAAEWHSQVQTALAFLSYLRAEPCPDDLAERTIQRLCGRAAQRASGERLRSRVLRFHPREWFSYPATITAIAAAIAVAAGVLILSPDPTSPYGPRRVPPEYFEKTSGHAGLFDSNYTRLPLGDEWPAIEFMPRTPDTSLGAFEAAGRFPRWMDQSVGLGPRVLPASSKRHVERSSQ